MTIFHCRNIWGSFNLENQVLIFISLRKREAQRWKVQFSWAQSGEEESLTPFRFGTPKRRWLTTVFIALYPFVTIVVRTWNPTYNHLTVRMHWATHECLGEFCQFNGLILKIYASSGFCIRSSGLFPSRIDQTIWILLTVGSTPWMGDQSYAGHHKHRWNEDRHPCLQWGSTPRS
jgi:hypothetical protein